MSEALLLLRLEGPMQSWGTRARWDVRDTGLEPTKSGVLGLLGCALGLCRQNSELEALDARLLFGVRADRPGVVSTDFHTVTGYHRTAAGDFKCGGSATVKSLAKARENGESTIVSHRDYLHDAAFLVALAVKSEYLPGEEGLLPRLGEALRKPVWPPYLGRKSCVPSRPIFERLTDEYDDLEAALRQEPWTPLRWKGERKGERMERLEAWIEDPEGPYERQDALRLNQMRFYDFRRCRRLEISTDSLQRRDP